MMSGLFFAEGVAEAEHEVVGEVEVAELVADLQEGSLPDVGFQGECLLEYACVRTFGIDVAAETDIDAENRQGQLGSE